MSDRLLASERTRTMKSKIVNYCLRATIVVAIMPFILLSAFNHPSADDYCYAFRSLNKGFWALQFDLYWTWTGRFFASAAISAYPYLADFIGLGFLKAYVFVGWVSISFLLLSIFLLLKSLFRELLSLKLLLWSSLGFVTLYINLMPSTVEGIYWLAGASTYIWGSSLGLMGLSIILNLSHTEETPGYWQSRRYLLYIAACIVLILCATSSNEITAFILTAVLGMGTVAALQIGSSNFLTWSLGFLTAITGILISFLSPGNAVRYEDNPIPLSYFEVLVRAVDSFESYLFSWMLDPIVLSSGILILPSAFLLMKSQFFPRELLKMRNVLTIFIVPCLGLIFASFLLLYKVVGYLPPRALNIIYLLFLIGWFLIVPLLLNATSAADEPKLPEYMYMVVKSLVILSLLFNSSFLIAAKDVILYAPRYNAELQDRYDKIDQALAGAEKDVQVKPLKTLPATLYYKDIAADSKYVHNVCQAGLFGLNSIAISQ